MAAILGPVQLVIIGLENDKLKGQISRDLHRASESGSIRVLDALAIQKTAQGTVYSLGGSDLTPDQRVAYGEIIGGLLGFGATGTEAGMDVGAEMGAQAFAGQNFGLSGADIQAIAADIPAGMTGLMILFEHRWALPLKQAIEDAGGVVLVQGMVQPEAIIALGEGMPDDMFAPPDSESSMSEQAY